MNKLKKEKKVNVNNEKGIIVPVVWIEGLLSHLDRVEMTEGHSKEMERACLEGYLKSAKFLLHNERINF